MMHVLGLAVMLIGLAPIVAGLLLSYGGNNDGNPTFSEMLLSLVLGFFGAVIIMSGCQIAFFGRGAA